MRVKSWGCHHSESNNSRLLDSEAGSDAGGGGRFCEFPVAREAVDDRTVVTAPGAGPILLLVVIVPVNVHAAHAGLTLGPARYRARAGPSQS